jgi:hypothetical protein
MPNSGFGIRLAIASDAEAGRTNQEDQDQELSR